MYARTPDWEYGISSCCASRPAGLDVFYDRHRLATGTFIAPDGGVCIAALKKLCQSGFLGKADRILIYNTGSGYKYLEAWKQHLNEA